MNVLEVKGLASDLDYLLFGYMMPGHGLKGKQHPVNDDPDVASIYDLYSSLRSPIVIWAKVSTRKRLAEINKANASCKTKKIKADDEVPFCINQEY